MAVTSDTIKYNFKLIISLKKTDFSLDNLDEWSSGVGVDDGDEEDVDDAVHVLDSSFTLFPVDDDEEEEVRE